MRIIRQGFTELQQEISLFSIVFYANIDLFQFSQIKIFVSQNETSTITYHSIENFMGYKMMLNSRSKYAVFKISSIPQ
jgi:hypothetical protein